MAINLSRNTKVYFTTNVNSTTGVFTDATASVTETSVFEIQILDGYSFSQNTETQQITVNEAGNVPVRGSRTFNTALAPVDWSISTYFRPVRASSRANATERFLWNALFGDKPIASAGTTVTSITRTANTSSAARITVSPNFGTVPVIGDSLMFSSDVNTNSVTDWAVPAVVTAIPATGVYDIEYLRAPPSALGTTANSVGSLTAYTGQWGQAGLSTGTPWASVSTMGSQKNQLQKFAMLFAVDNVVYCIDNCTLTQASIDFGIDAIATIAWTGQGTALKQLTNVLPSTLTAAGGSTAPLSNANFIANKLSTMQLRRYIGGGLSGASSGTNYTVAITGGNITIANNVTFLTPAQLATVNTPFTSFTGTRAITGNVTAYLKTGADSPNNTGQLLTDLLSLSASDTEPKYRVVLEMGGGSNSNRVEFDMTGAMLQIPSVDVQDVVSTTINFVAQPFDGVLGNNAFTIDKSNELWVRYYAA